MISIGNGLISWNINSIRIRINHIKTLYEQYKPDFLLLQETKCPDDMFPEAELRDIGFKHLYFHGEKGYNGVAILANQELHDIKNLKLAEKIDTRHISGVTKDGLTIHNFYIPAGGDLPDPSLNLKYGHKLQFVEDMISFFDAYPPVNTVIAGDFNIAPFEHDVWSHKQLLNVVSHTQPEIDRITNLCKAQNWHDIVRIQYPEPQKIYTWWSYRNRDWQKSNRGRRLDHIWLSSDIDHSSLQVQILKEARNWAGPSDHVPIILTIK